MSTLVGTGPECLIFQEAAYKVVEVSPWVGQNRVLPGWLDG